MKKSCEISGLTIVSIQEGKELGTVKQLVIDPAAGTIAALLVDDGNWYLGAKLLPFSAVSGLGEYAVTINSETDILPVVPSSEFAPLLQQDVHVVGSSALTVTGNFVGTVVEIIINSDGKITDCLIEEAGETDTVSAERVITYGKEILIIAANGDSQLAREYAKVILSPPVIVEETLVEPVLSPPIIAEETLVEPVLSPPAIVEETLVEPVLSPPAIVEETLVEPVLSPPAIAEEALVEPVLSPPVIAEETLVEPVLSPPAIAEIHQNEPTDQEPDALAKMFEEKQRKYLLGKRASRRIEGENGVTIVDQGEEITEAVLQKAKLSGKFVELSMSIY